MRVGVASDIHTEFYEDPRSVLKKLLKPKVDVLIVAGDLGSVHAYGHLMYSLNWMKDHFEHVVYVTGNHEFYGTSSISTPGELEEDIRRVGVHYLKNEIVDIDGVIFAGSPLWFKDDPMCWALEDRLNDFIQIYQFRGWVYNLNRECVKFLKSLDKVDIIVTHHAPTSASIHPRYKEDKTNIFYITECTPWIAEKADILIHGHMHHRLDYFIGDARVICNPVGYPGEHSTFELKAFDI